MKLVYKAILYSLILHVIYFASMGFYGLIKTSVYQPNMSQEWDQVTQLQSEVVFGVVLSPWYYVASFSGVSLICGILLLAYHKYTGTNG